MDRMPELSENSDAMDAAAKLPGVSRNNERTGRRGRGGALPVAFSSAGGRRPNPPALGNSAAVSRPNGTDRRNTSGPLSSSAASRPLDRSSRGGVVASSAKSRFFLARSEGKLHATKRRTEFSSIDSNSLDATPPCHQNDAEQIPRKKRSNMSASVNGGAVKSSRVHLIQSSDGEEDTVAHRKAAFLHQKQDSCYRDDHGSKGRMTGNQFDKLVEKAQGKASTVERAISAGQLLKQNLQSLTAAPPSPTRRKTITSAPQSPSQAGNSSPPPAYSKRSRAAQMMRRSSQLLDRHKMLSNSSRRDSQRQQQVDNRRRSSCRDNRGKQTSMDSERPPLSHVVFRSNGTSECSDRASSPLRRGSVSAGATDTQSSCPAPDRAGSDKSRSNRVLQLLRGNGEEARLRPPPLFLEEGQVAEDEGAVRDGYRPSRSESSSDAQANANSSILRQDEPVHPPAVSLSERQSHDQLSSKPGSSLRRSRSAGTTRVTSRTADSMLALKTVKPHRVTTKPKLRKKPVSRMRCAPGTRKGIRGLANKVIREKSSESMPVSAAALYSAGSAAQGSAWNTKIRNYGNNVEQNAAGVDVDDSGTRRDDGSESSDGESDVSVSSSESEFDIDGGNQSDSSSQADSEIEYEHRKGKCGNDMTAIQASHEEDLESAPNVSLESETSGSHQCGGQAKPNPKARFDADHEMEESHSTFHETVKKGRVSGCLDTLNDTEGAAMNLTASSDKGIGKISTEEHHDRNGVKEEEVRSQALEEFLEEDVEELSESREVAGSQERAEKSPLRNSNNLTRNPASGRRSETETATMQDAVRRPKREESSRDNRKRSSSSAQPDLDCTLRSCTKPLAFSSGLSNSKEKASASASAHGSERVNSPQKKKQRVYTLHDEFRRVDEDQGLGRLKNEGLDTTVSISKSLRHADEAKNEPRTEGDMMPSVVLDQIHAVGTSYTQRAKSAKLREVFTKLAHVRSLSHVDKSGLSEALADLCAVALQQEKQMVELKQKLNESLQDLRSQEMNARDIIGPEKKLCNIMNLDGTPSVVLMQVCALGLTCSLKAQSKNLAATFRKIAGVNPCEAIDETDLNTPVTKLCMSVHEQELQISRLTDRLARIDSDADNADHDAENGEEDVIIID